LWSGFRNRRTGARVATLRLYEGRGLVVVAVTATGTALGGFVLVAAIVWEGGAGDDGDGGDPGGAGGEAAKAALEGVEGGEEDAGGDDADEHPDEAVNGGGWCGGEGAGLFFSVGDVLFCGGHPCLDGEGGGACAEDGAEEDGGEYQPKCESLHCGT
jgi:hypothetical protein